MGPFDEGKDDASRFLRLERPVDVTGVDSAPDADGADEVCSEDDAGWSNG